MGGLAEQLLGAVARALLERRDPTLAEHVVSPTTADRRLEREIDEPRHHA